MKSRWKTFLLYASLIIVGGGLLYVLIETVRAKNTGFESKTLWDWMELLIIPFVLAIGAYFLNRSERNTEREIANNRRQETTLQIYIDRMSELLIEKNLQTTKKKSVRDVARTRTVTVMRGLDAKRNNIVLRFLREANLITGANSILKGANMEFVNLKHANLVHVNLTNADLGNANLQFAVLRLAILVDAGLEHANMKNAWLPDANLQNASFEKTILKDAVLSSANMKNAFLLGANLADADLSGANLQDAFLDDADLKNAYLEDANLLGASLKNANLKNANLENAMVTVEQLATVKTLQGATMPDGTKHN